MLLLKKPTPKVTDFSAPAPQPVAKVAPLALVSSEPKEAKPVPSLLSTGMRVWQSAVEYCRIHCPHGTEPAFAAMVLLKMSREITVVEFKNGRERVARHPALKPLGTFVNESGKEIPYYKVIDAALKNSEFTRFSLYPVDGELVARSPSGRWKAYFSDLMPEPWYTAAVTMGKQAKSSPKLDRFNYEAKLYLFTAPGTEDGVQSSRIMINSRRRAANEMRMYKGHADHWRDL